VSNQNFISSVYRVWLEQDYNSKPHSALGRSPLDYYLSQAGSLRMVDDPAMLEPLFLRREQRKVRHDATISVHNLLFEVPPRFIGQRIEVRFEPSHPSEVFIYEDGQQQARLTPVNLLDNAKVKRQPPRLKLSSFSAEEVN
jgi:hypothetical protein